MGTIAAARHPTTAQCAKTRISRASPRSADIPVLRRGEVPFSWTPGRSACSVLIRIIPGNCFGLDPDRAGLHGFAPLFGSPAPPGVENDDLAHGAGLLQLVHRRSGPSDVTGPASFLRARLVDVNLDVLARDHGP